MNKDATCRLCNYTWKPMKKDPKACPKCKRYDWKTERANQIIQEK